MSSARARQWVAVFRGGLPGLNQLLKAVRAGQYERLKREVEGQLQASYLEARFPREPLAAYQIGLMFYESLRRGRPHDRANVIGGAEKFILDALVSYRAIRDDGPACDKGYLFAPRVVFGDLPWPTAYITLQELM